MIKPKNIIIPITAIILEVLFPCIFIYFNNAGEAYLIDILPIVGSLSGIFIAIAAVLSLIYKDIPKATATTVVLVLVFLNFSIIETAFKKLSPNLYYWHILYILIIVVICWALIVKKYVKSEYALLGEGVLALVCAVLIILNGVMAIPTITQKLSSNVENKVFESEGITQQEDMPNVYLMIFDEYAGYECLKEYCDYENSQFYDLMKERGFNVSYLSYGKTILTHREVPNLMNLDFVTSDEMLSEEMDKLLINPAIYQLLHKAGYEINVAGGDFLDDENCEYSYEGVSNKEFSAEYYIVMNTAYYPFYNAVKYDEISELNNHLKYVAESHEITDNGLLTVSYICSPHLPWFADENGDFIDASNRENWADRSIYLGQLKYVNKLITATVEEIIENDPDSIIMLFSDHGFRVVTEMKTKYGQDDNTEDEIYQKNILNMVYYRGEQLEIEGLTNIDTVRKVFNKLLGTDFEMLG